MKSFSKNKTVLALLLSTAFASGQVHAEQDSSVEHDLSGEWGFTVTASAIGIDSEAAAKEGISDSAYTIGLTMDYVKNSWITTFGFDLAVYDDENEFSQDVVGTGLYNDGDRETKSSSANGAIFSIASGYQKLYGENQDTAVNMQAGFSIVGFSERSISTCTDCRSEDIDIDGGAFVKLSAVKSGEKFSVGAYIQQYISGDLGTAVGVQIGSRF
ncbi:hypothetical protein [Flocculibacter collagenilyticus]|uniref:hypothetical protein n=1 Tax=Flocculibacter collagenilyticus TaxID=2744479 RepID=UPI0018F2AB28|nr:hypothetical protein [Flocculibacter collagenilyticus]